MERVTYIMQLMLSNWYNERYYNNWSYANALLDNMEGSYDIYQQVIVSVSTDYKWNS